MKTTEWLKSAIESKERLISAADADIERAHKRIKEAETEIAAYRRDLETLAAAP